ncbi:MAG: YkgJ family cysteine cluster protein [Acetobacteraceae bacterium]|nr:YkgJ family cysteine cluster protein [Acetobacteraceae bacterium]
MTTTRLELSGHQLLALARGMQKVPCNGCTECCRGDTIVLKPEYGDDPAAYRWHTEYNRVQGRMDMVLDRKPNGDCVYLSATGCTIHGKAPTVCREFDCRALFKALTRDQRRQLVKNGALKKSVFAAGRARLHTLKDPP